MCALVVIYTVVEFTALAISSCSPRAAARRIAKERSRDTTIEIKNSFQELQSNNILRLALLFLGAFPRIIKLYGMTGITAAKVCGSIFLSSFVVFEVLV